MDDMNGAPTTSFMQRKNNVKTSRRRCVTEGEASKRESLHDTDVPQIAAQAFSRPDTKDAKPPSGIFCLQLRPNESH